MPSADFCPAVRLPLGHLSRRSDAEQISWGKLSRFPCTVAESTLCTLMDTDFAVRCPLVRCWRLISGFCPSTRTFDPCFFWTPPRDGSPCIITRPSPPSGWPEDFHLQAAKHAQHTTNPPCGGPVARSCFGGPPLFLRRLGANRGPDKQVRATLGLLIPGTQSPVRRGRDAGCPTPPAQIRTCRATAYGSYRRYLASMRK